MYHFIGDHDNEMHPLLPNHLPKVSAGVFKRTLSYNIAILSSIYCKLKASGTHNIQCTHTLGLISI